MQVRVRYAGLWLRLTRCVRVPACCVSLRVYVVCVPTPTARRPGHHRRPCCPLCAAQAHKQCITRFNLWRRAVRCTWRSTGDVGLTTCSSTQVSQSLSKTTYLLHVSFQTVNPYVLYPIVCVEGGGGGDTAVAKMETERYLTM